MAARVDHDLGLVVDHEALEDRVDHELPHPFANVLLCRFRHVMRGHDDGFDSFRATELIFDRDLGLAVRPQKRKGTVLAGLREPAREPVCQRDGQGHELRCFATREADHHALVPRTLQLEGIVLVSALALLQRVVDAGRDVGRLLFKVNLDQRMVCVEADLFVVVPDVADRFADSPLYVELRMGGDLADDYAQAFGNRRLAGYASIWILPEHSVEHGVRDLVTHFVRMAFGDRFRGQEERRGLAERS